MSCQYRLQEYLKVQSKDHLLEYLERAVKYNERDELVFHEQKEHIRHVQIHVSLLIHCIKL